MSGNIVFLLVAVAIAAAVLWIPKTRKVRLVGGVLLVVAMLGELFVCNFHSFHLWFGGYGEAQKLDLSGQSQHVVLTGTENGSLTGQTLTLTVREVDRKVGTLRIDCHMPEANPQEHLKGTASVTVKVEAKDQTNAASWRTIVSDGQLIRGDAHSAYIVLDLSGEVSELRIKLTANGDPVTLQGVTLNQPIPLRLSILRLCLFMLLSLGLYALCTFPTWRATYGERKKCLRVAVYIMTVLMMLSALGINFLNMYDTGGGLSTGFANKSGNQITQELVDAFEAGQVSLLEKPNQEILQMENPYDWSARLEAGMYYKWDHLLFEGKYYSYYGIAPVILLFLPYHAITGYYFPTAEAVWLFGALGMLFLTLAFLELVDRFGRRVPNNILFCTLFIMQISSGVWYNFMRDNFYEIAQACGFLFTCAGFFFLLRAGVLGEGERIKYRHLALSATSFSLAVLSRPTLALYCITALIFLFFGLKKHIQQAKAQCTDGKAGHAALRRPVIQYLVAALLPYVLIGGVQMLYNYARFGSVLDFGIQYSLTINDFTRSQYHTDLAMIGFYNFLLAPPVIRPEFPYVFSNFSTLSANGYYYVANRNAVGLLFRALPVFGYLGAGRALTSMEKKQRIMALCLIIPTCILAPMIIIFSIWESGYGVRYCTDFAWQLILGGAMVLWYLYVHVADRQMKACLQTCFVVAAMVALVINGAMLYDYMEKAGYLAARYLSFARTFDFWL